MTSLGVLGASGANALDWSETPHIVGTIIGGGLGSAVGFTTSNPVVVGAAATAGGIAGGKLGPYVAENPKQSADEFTFALSGPTGIISSGYKAGASAVVNYVKNLFW